MNASRSKIAALALLVLGATLLPPTANATGWTGQAETVVPVTYYGSPGYGGQGYVQGYPGYGNSHRYQEDYHRGRHGRYHDLPRPRFCQPQEAIEKANWMGLRRAGIQRVTPDVIVVTGGYRGYWARIVFDRQSPHCRVIKSQGI